MTDPYYMHKMGVTSVTIYDVEETGPFIVFVVDSNGKRAAQLSEWPVRSDWRGRWVDGVGFALKADSSPGIKLWEHEFEHVRQAARKGEGFAQFEFEYLANTVFGCLKSLFGLGNGDCYTRNPLEEAAKRAAIQRSEDQNQKTKVTVIAKKTIHSSPLGETDASDLSQ
jgi:hypothetical protein